ncbi:MAG: hypothetical protein M1829_002061 [Trizodia sp. TS-e1964]|nr:MAG: hypothetical protein M1829_002061 [Trizodia sp. TS-e1964]
MSIFSKIRNAKEAAAKHKSEKAQAAASPVVVPYRHIPTHAATDALAGAPSSWRAHDRPLILEHNRRRSRPRLSRNSSTLSATTTLQRNGDFAWSDERRNLQSPRYSALNAYREINTTRSMRAGNDPSRDAAGHSAASNSSSSSSSEILEIRPVVHRYPTQNIMHTLHTSTRRKLGEAPMLSAPAYPLVRGPSVKQIEPASPSSSKEAKPKKKWSFRRGSGGQAKEKERMSS